MAKNDILLLDRIIEDLNTQYGDKFDTSERLELFCFDQILKDYDCTYEEIENCWTDGTDDGGIDGFFIFVDGHIVNDIDETQASKLNPRVTLYVFTVKHASKFQLSPINSLQASLMELLDLTLKPQDFKYPYNEDILEKRELFKEVYISLAPRKPKLDIELCYCCRGETKTLSNNLKKPAQRVARICFELFSSSNSNFSFYGASELLSLSRQQKTFSLKLPYAESFITREGSHYIILSKIPDYFQFITDENGNLRRYLFESNVRDYLGEVRVNNDIFETLKGGKEPSDEDFWWLNNGVTILTTSATPAGKALHLENVNIVNGLQTTETLYRYMSQGGKRNDQRAILIKIIVAAEDYNRARIIKATNYQNTVDLSSIRGLDKIQKDIDEFLFNHGWFYDRRKNFYKNEGRPADRIVSPPYLAASFRAIALCDPASGPRQRAKSLRDDLVYNQIFNDKIDLNVYLVCLEITRKVELTLLTRRKVLYSPPIALVHFISYMYACEMLGRKNYEANEIASLKGSIPSDEDVSKLKDELLLVSKKYKGKSKNYRGIKIDPIMLSELLDKKYPETKQSNQPNSADAKRRAAD